MLTPMLRWLLVSLLPCAAACGGPAEPGRDGAGGQAEESGAGVGGHGGDDGGGGAGGAPGPRGIIDGPIGEWVYYDIPGAVCANGTQTGIGVNQGAGDRVVIYMSGGSACLDEGCTIGTPSMRKDGGFREAELAACVAGQCDGAVVFPSESIFSRSSALNPFRDATFVFISNCSGDYYIGDNEHAFPSWTASFHGSRNQGLFAAELAASFPAASRIILAGGSAGSVGALLNYWQWVAAFPETRVDLVADSFALVFADGPEFRYPLHDPQLPPDCTACAMDYRALYAFNSSIAPDSRLAVLDSENNWTLDLVTSYTEGLEALQPLLDRLPNTKYFVADGNVHILLQHPLDSTSTNVQDAEAGTVDLAAFLGRMQDDDPSWESWTCLGE